MLPHICVNILVQDPMILAVSSACMLGLCGKVLEEGLQRWLLEKMPEGVHMSSRARAAAGQGRAPQVVVPLG